MKILVVGSGSREHALAWKLSRERSVTGIVCAPGNPGIAGLARCMPGDLDRPESLLAIAAQEGVDLTVVGPELPLSRGLVDAFVAAGRPIVGPTRAASELESSKVFAKAFMARHGVPTARFLVFDEPSGAVAAIEREELGWPVVVKADGLAAGKGVVIAEDIESGRRAVTTAMVDRRFGTAGQRLVLEECLRGTEASFFALVDGTDVVTLSSAQDHKRIFDDDRGPNTGGMGAFSPSPLVTSELEEHILRTIIRPVLAGLEQEGRPFNGFLYAGLMLTQEGPKVIEFNVRFGDPEAQVVLPRLDEDLSWLLGAAAMHALSSRAARFTVDPHVGVVLAAKGYPDEPVTGQVIAGLDEAGREPGALVFHAGTARRGGDVVTAGGRVLTVVGRGPTYQAARAVAYRATGHIRFDGMQFRRDIGRSALTT